MGSENVDYIHMANNINLREGLMSVIMDARFEFLPAVFLKVQLCCYEMLCPGVNSYRRFEGTTFRNVGNCCAERHSFTSQKP